MNTTWSLLLFTAVLYILVLKPTNASLRIFAVSDYFTMMNGKQLSQQATDDLGTPRTSKADVDNLRLLSNDAVFGLPDKYRTCVMKTTQNSAESVAKDKSKAKHWFEDVHKTVFVRSFRFSFESVALISVDPNARRIIVYFDPDRKRRDSSLDRKTWRYDLTVYFCIL
ncbi:hypothetical protein QZH41_013680 [Actinostola sp. cb2023]|nr:hypothetical protein QZH41_013680 [Actinostola sp. cb2023]